jgi:hypothetical protein
MYALKMSFRDLLDRMEFEHPVVTIPASRKAANADAFKNAGEPSRLRRRMRRMDGMQRSGNVGWSVRTW